MPIAALTRAHIVAGRERRAKTPSQANNWLNMMRSLCQWAKDAEHIGDDPTEGVKTVKRPKTGGFREAGEEDIAAFRAHWPPGTRERLALEIFLNTGLRRGDAARFGRQHVKNDLISIATEKSGFAITVKIPVNDALATELALHRPAGLTWIAQDNGEALAKESLGNWFHEVAVAARAPFSAHGLRKAAAARLIDMGLTDAELEQIMGWVPGSGMTRIYTKRRNADALAARAAAKIKAESGTFYSQPDYSVGKEKQKT
jgi:integrase